MSGESKRNSPPLTRQAARGIVASCVLATLRNDAEIDTSWIYTDGAGNERSDADLAKMRAAVDELVKHLDARVIAAGLR